ncbi:hypothetical protein KSC_090930 [Ktedonobacter sp. SOSP1-52]|nr:hypothetical protein KSC_090930 [Ktedonobacter sp. SOSP1-52]
MLTLHHIISDGWSSGRLIEELTRLYLARQRGEAATLPALPVQYADYASGSVPGSKVRCSPGTWTTGRRVWRVCHH